MDDCRIKDDHLLDKVMFGVWLAYAITATLELASGVADGDPEPLWLVVAMCGLACMTYCWRLWSEHDTQVTINVKAPAGGITADDVREWALCGMEGCDEPEWSMFCEVVDAVDGYRRAKEEGRSSAT